MRKRSLIVVAIVGAFTLAGGTIVIASSQSVSVHPRSSGSSTTVRPLIAAQATGGGCRFGYDTQSSTLIPPDDSTADNIPANTVTINKPCAGSVMGLWVGEISTATAGDFIHMDMRATCTGTGGFNNPCTVGQQVFGSPGHTFVQNVQSGVQTHSLQMVWTGLKRGIWRFDVLPGGNNRANIQFRSFTIQAFNGG